MIYMQYIYTPMCRVVYTYICHIFLFWSYYTSFVYFQYIICTSDSHYRFFFWIDFFFFFDTQNFFLCGRSYTHSRITTTQQQQQQQIRDRLKTKQFFFNINSKGYYPRSLLEKRKEINKNIKIIFLNYYSNIFV